MTKNNFGNLILVDGHVHLHRCFNTAAFIVGAHANFARTAEQFGRKQPFVGVLFLTEGIQENGFDRLLRYQEQPTPHGTPELNAWRLRQTDEPTSLCITDDNERTMIVVAGRQIPTREHLEVLAVGTRRSFEANRPVEETIQAVANAGALPIVPWGAGKWMGTRGQHIRRLIQDSRLPPFFLGDSANRPAFWLKPRLFRLADEAGIHNLPGSDPLPFPSECRRAGRCGFVLRGSLDRQMPARDLKERLFEASTTIQPFGSQEGALRFLRNQFRMQYRKRVDS